MNLEKIRRRQKSLEISIGDIAELLDLEAYKIQKYFESGEASYEDIEEITNLLGLDSLGNELFDVDVVIAKRAEQKALYIVSLVQDTSSLEGQGLDVKDIKQRLLETKEQFLNGKYRATLWRK